ncbi:uncharacterized protein BDR25DRAFT_228861 [Lindgomyces ingoldianus]|uniref:Uncharacterized protein n=1 Tax=Lindgomyces ingoldianus TaxID=673940 RepID=A0ACB6QQV6_9PLEO|nr:uncharacterized protein BDR25DRAFT_228861 [Lindgomyces ingoldianus]KAF2469247.1 hypothetical protein BDR25DRAFT_228861 [Lindgomyces ingoldianus]
MSVLSLIFFASLPFAAFGAQRRATPESFQLYAYGDGLGGLPMFHADGYAYVGNPSSSNSSNAAEVMFSPGSDNTWFGSPNTTNLGNGTTPNWSNVTLFVPGPGSVDSRVGFLNGTNSSTSNVITSGFVFYGSTAMLLGDDGLETMWTGLAVGNTGVFAIYWNDTSSGQVPISMRRVAPSNPSRRWS